MTNRTKNTLLSLAIELLINLNHGIKNRGLKLEREIIIFCVWRSHTCGAKTPIDRDFTEAGEELYNVESAVQLYGKHCGVIGDQYGSLELDALLCIFYKFTSEELAKPIVPLFATHDLRI